MLGSKNHRFYSIASHLAIRRRGVKNRYLPLFSFNCQSGGGREKRKNLFEEIEGKKENKIHVWYTCHPWIRTIRARQGGEGALARPPDKRFSSRSFRSFTDLARLESLKVPRRPRLINGHPSPYRFELVSRSKSLIAAESENGIPRDFSFANISALDR